MALPALATVRRAGLQVTALGMSSIIGGLLAGSMATRGTHAEIQALKYECSRLREEQRDLFHEIKAIEDRASGMTDV
jgi:hypothetical protein